MSPYWIPVGSDVVSDMEEKEMSYPNMDLSSIPSSIPHWESSSLAVPVEMIGQVLQMMTDEELVAEAQKRGIITAPQDVVNEDAINLNEVEEML